MQETNPGPSLLIEAINQGFALPQGFAEAVAAGLLEGYPVLGSARYRLPKGIKIVLLKETP